MTSLSFQDWSFSLPRSCPLQDGRSVAALLALALGTCLNLRHGLKMGVDPPLVLGFGLLLFLSLPLHLFLALFPVQAQTDIFGFNIGSNVGASLYLTISIASVNYLGLGWHLTMGLLLYWFLKPNIALSLMKLSFYPIPLPLTMEENFTDLVRSRRIDMQIRSYLLTQVLFTSLTAMVYHWTDPGWPVQALVGLVLLVGLWTCNTRIAECQLGIEPPSPLRHIIEPMAERAGQRELYYPDYYTPRPQWQMPHLPWEDPNIPS